MGFGWAAAAAAVVAHALSASSRFLLHSFHWPKYFTGTGVRAEAGVG
jgi:hypothetical protein